MCGTTSRDIRMAGYSVWSNASCHSASAVLTMSVPFAVPTLLTRMSMPPNAASVASTTVVGAFGRGQIGGDGDGRLRNVANSAAACSSASAPRAHRHTRHPSAASALALANPNPRLDPVTIAALPVSSSRSI